MYKKTGKLFVISGPSGAGKGTINKMVLDNRDDIVMSVSATTRQPRKGEQHGKNYYFISEEEFKARIQNDEFVEWAKVYGNYYGTLKEEVTNILATGKNVVLEIDIQGAQQVKNKYAGVFVFILPPSLVVLKDRVIKRGSETEESLNIRMLEAKKEIAFIERYDYYIVNDDANKAAKQFESIVEAENLKVNASIIDLIKNENEEFNFEKE